MSYNESYASYSISTYAKGDTGAASTYGDVFVEHTSQDLEAACDGVQCYVACSCKNNGPDDEDGWFSTIAEAQHGNPNAQVYTVTSDIHYSRDSVSTSSLNDLTIATASTTALANQTPISRASTLSSLTIDAPTLKTASTSGTKATCYKKVPCADGYFATEPTSDQREAIEFYEDTSTGITCYKSNYCKDGYTDDISLKKDGTDSYAYDDTLTCYVERTDLKEIEFFVDLYNTDCLYYLDYNIIDSEGDESYNGDVEGKTAKLGIKCGSSTETYTTTVYYDELDEHFEYRCSQGNASLESITIGGQTYEDGDIMTVDVYDEGTYDLPVRLGIRSSDTCNPSCPSGYFPTEADCKNEYAYMYDYAHTCVYDSSSKCYGKGTCPSGYFLGKPSDSDFEYVVQSTSPSGADCYRAVTCVKGKDTNGSCPSGSNQIAYHPTLTCCEELPYYLNLFINGTLNGGSYEYTTTYTVTTESGQGNSSWTVSDLTNANVDLSCNDSYPPTQFKGLTFHHNASASANTKTITGFYCSGLPELEAVGIPSVSLYDGSEITMTVAGQGGRNLHVKINYSTYDPCGQTPGYYARKADCEATITNPNTQVCQTTNASNYRCYEVVKGCNSNNGYYTLESDCKKGSKSYSYAGCQLDSSSGCYKQSYCDTALGYYSLSSDEVVTFSSSYTELTNGTGTKCRTVVGCNESNGYYESLSQLSCSNGYNTYPTELGFTCYKCIEECPTGYFAINPNDYQLIEFSSTTEKLSDGTVCYEPIGCSDDLAGTTRCYTVGSSQFESLGDVFCNGFAPQMMCGTGSGITYYNYYKENPYGLKHNDVMTFKEQTISGSTCYHASTCKSGYTETETDGDCYTYGQLTCYEEEEVDDDCPDGYYYSASRPFMVSMTFSQHASYPNCYKASCNSLNGWGDTCLGGKFEGELINPLGQSDITVSPSATLLPITPNCDSETWNGKTCYKNEVQTIVCPEYYDSLRNCSTSMNYKTTTPTSGTGTCYRATSCKSGYSPTGTGTSCTDNGITCKAIDGWPTDVYFDIDCNNIGDHYTTMDVGCNAAAKCIGTVHLGSSTQTILDLGPHTITDNLVYRADVSMSMQEAVGTELEFQMLTDQTPVPDTRNGIDICCATSSNNLGGAMQIQPCKKLSFKKLNILKGGISIYHENDGGTITLNVSNGTTSKSSTYNVHVTYTAPNF